MEGDRTREKGGWIYQNKKGGLKAAIKTTVDPQDDALHIFLGNPPSKKGMRVVGTFHTHASDVGVSGEAKVLENGNVLASGDYLPNYQMRVPGMVLTRPPGGAEQGYRIYGPERGFMNIGVPKGCR